MWNVYNPSSINTAQSSQSAYRFVQVAFLSIFLFSACTPKVLSSLKAAIAANDSTSTAVQTPDTTTTPTPSDSSTPSPSPSPSASPSPGPSVTPTLSYSGATGTTSSIHSAMSIAPTTLTAGDSAITACGIKSGSANAGSFPSSLTVNPTTCVISGTPTASLASTVFTLVATNSAGTSSAATVTLSVSSCDSTSSPYGGGSGTTMSPYLICTPTQLGQVSSNLSATFQLSNNIDMTSVSFTPIGNHATPFTGTFDGNHLTISNLTINLPTTDYVGLFGGTGTYSTIQNLTLSNVNITGQNNVGAIVGEYTTDNTRTQIYTGLISSGSVTGTASNVGGIIGSIYYNGDIQYSSSSAQVTGLYTVGGLIGNVRSSNARHCFATGSVTGTDTSYYPGNLGGLIGFANMNSGIYYSYATGNVTGGTAGGYGTGIGGLVGELDYDGNITNSYATGNVTLTLGNRGGVGGLVGVASSNGYSNTFTNTFATGAVTATGALGIAVLGGLVGQWQNNGGSYTAVNSYWDTQTTGLSTTDSSIGGTGLTTSQMRTSSSFNTWDFTTIWNTPTASTYPTLR